MLKDTLIKVQTAERDAGELITGARKKAEQLISTAKADGEKDKTHIIENAKAAAGAEMAAAETAASKKILDAKKQDSEDIDKMKSAVKEREKEIIGMIKGRITGR